LLRDIRETVTTHHQHAAILDEDKTGTGDAVTFHSRSHE
jgi:hypothetical protein